MKSWILAAALLAAVPAFATPASELAPKQQVLTESFLSYHPDLKFRLQGMRALEDGDPAAAFKAFRDSARYADKASQAMVAEMLWNGQGVEADRALAYAWMDLAAERGYRQFVTLRERYWRDLDTTQQQRALEIGQTVYAEFGDAVAQERLERKLAQGRRQVTGSRTGFVGSLTIYVPIPGGFTTVDGSTYYADHYWRPKEYFAWQDQIWKDPPTGQVDVGPLQNLPPTPPAPAAD